jgi:MSHA biogenesis protein MshN
MSLINKMLQDLDARGSDSSAGIAGKVRPVAASPDRVIALGDVLAVVIVLSVLGVAGVFGWRYWKRPAAALPHAVAALAPNAAAPAAPKPLAPAAVVAPVVKAPVPASLPPVAQSKAAIAPPARGTMPGKRATPAPAKPVPHVAPPKTLVAAKHIPVPARPYVRPATKVAARKVANAPVASVPKLNGLELTAHQRAENAYRSALANLQEGRVAGAITALEQALQLDPQHEAARQTLVGLLIESKRGDEAMRHLQLGLTLDPRQPAMAMLLARLQIEHGGSGIDTLTRTLPYAAGNGEYHAFLAGVLQRQQRQREAIEQYQAALHASPQNGVWWMGLGISLLAEKRNAEALDAFGHARDTGNLSADLQAFVERKLQSLTH